MRNLLNNVIDCSFYRAQCGVCSRGEWAWRVQPFKQPGATRLVEIFLSLPLIAFSLCPTVCGITSIQPDISAFRWADPQCPKTPCKQQLLEYSTRWHNITVQFSISSRKHAILTGRAFFLSSCCVLEFSGLSSFVSVDPSLACLCAVVARLLFYPHSSAW